MLVEDPNLVYLHVENDVVVNRLLGNPVAAAPENCYVQTYPVYPGWKKINEDTFIPSEMTEEEFNTIADATKQEIIETKEYYDNLVASSHYQNNLSDEVKLSVDLFVSNFNFVYEKINQHKGWAIEYLQQKLSYGEPFTVRPNIENEV